MRKNILLIAILFITTIGIGQENQNTNNFMPDFNVKPPETSSLLKLIEMPVSYSSGLINLNIPIYSIKENDINYPISVDYNSSGVNVNERAGWVGMGFSINQPQITRNIKGLPDDYGGFIYENEYMYDNIVSGENPPQGKKSWSMAHNAAIGGVVDLESDEYRIILPNGESVRFYFSQDRTSEFPYGKIIQFPITNNKISPLFSETHISGWEVTDSKGFIYIYKTGNITNSTKSYTVANSSLPDLRGGSTQANYAVSWMLEKIISTTKNELHFTYQNFYYEDCNFTGQTREIDDYNFGNLPFVDEVITNYQLIYGQNCYLSSIEGKFGKVEFVLDPNQREDYSYGKKLEAIKIYSRLNNSYNLENNFLFKYFYRTSEAPMGSYYSCGYNHVSHFGNNDITKRLFLEKIIVAGNNTDINNKPFYKFDYDQTPLPHRFSYSVDWWGYFNGQNNNVIVPTVRETDDQMPNRNVNPIFSKAGLLNRVYYPTGGFSDFEFENNKAIIERGTITWSQGAYQPKIDELNIIPSIREGFVLNTESETPTVINSNGGQILKYIKSFSLKDNIIGYYSPGLNVPNIGFFVRIKPDCSSCLTINNSLPNNGDCYIRYKVLNGNNELYNKYVSMNSDIELEFEVGANNIIEQQNLTFEVEIFTGANNAYNFFSNSDFAHFDVSWKVIDTNLVRKFGNSYEIQVGGHRIKKITNYNSENIVVTEKEFSYDDTNGIVTNIFNSKLVNNYRFSQKAYITSDNYYPLNSYNGQPVGYRLVTEKQISENNSLNSSYKYSFYSNPQGYNNCYFYLNSFGYGVFPCGDDPNNGNLIENKLGEERKIENIYENFHLQNSVQYIKGFNAFNKIPLSYNIGMDWDYAKYEIATYYLLNLSKAKTTENMMNNSITSLTNNYYAPNHLQLTRQITSNSNGDLLETKYYYPQDSEMNSEPQVQNLINKNIVATPLVTETWRNDALLTRQHTTYKDWGNNLLLPEIIQAKKGSGNEETRVVFDSYDSFGNPTCVKQENGMYISYIWGYNNTKPVAKIENIKYSDIPVNLITDIQNATTSTSTNSGSPENVVLGYLEALRNSPALVNAMVTTFTYKPLIGVSTITDPKGMTTYYEYDSFGRLSAVKDAAGNKLSENEYHYKD